MKSPPNTHRDRWFLLIALGSFFLLAGSYLGLVQGVWRLNYPARDTYPIRGLDVSHHQGKIGWQRIPTSEYQFVYLKATEGGDFTDSQFQENWSEARAAGFRVGAYHFFTFCRDGRTQANHFLKIVPTSPDSLPPAIDLEFGGNCAQVPSNDQLAAQLGIFVSRIRAHLHREPVLYFTHEFYQHYGTTILVNYPKSPWWVRDVFRSPSWAQSHGWHLWQFANRERVPGIQGPVDVNAFAFSNPKQWRAFYTRH
jgi:lysozyme